MDYDRKDAKAWATENVRGFYQCPITPMTSDYKFDVDGIRYNIDKYVEMGVNGFVGGGFIAECWNVTLSDWYRYHEILAEANDGRLDLWTIILDPSVYQAIEKMKFVEELGFNGAEVINPVVQLKRDDEIFDWYKYLTDRTDMAVCLYRTPVSGTVLSWDLLRRLADLETVIGVKQGVMSRAETLKIRQLMPDGFNTMEPFEYFFLDDLRNGGTVCWGELSYMLYGKKRHLAKDYVRLAHEGKWEEARAASEGLNEVREFYHDNFLWDIARTATYASALANVKAWYEAIGLKAGPILPPVADVTQEKKEQISEQLKALGVA
ncbi:dihydrodipicolinate synthetase [Aurantiacibacter atlanticus]|uniref:Dihydrodipicolinate synthetase n=1 Tax=Aurantiacibacter atlanticus TaxID=1648404 RepID=A0A0H4W0A1_9SPHN|nr:dihydrodipicolinate synthase family protein [Aurantiacibacter atlanticus]AKQ42908.1 dihydrodipicolinate synthetase [Aurantiacibacter atlanticus]MDF1834393.1 dihydrodipicolinate synthase family protein [Alteraurantiacibacter sp. bin_em_oilr2.035]